MDFNSTSPKPSLWDGTIWDTFVNTLTATLMILFSFGIASPWAFCHMTKFIAEHTVIDGKRLQFDGTGSQLFTLWILWSFFTIITFGIYSFWAYPKFLNWICEHIHFDENSKVSMKQHKKQLHKIARKNRL